MKELGNFFLGKTTDIETELETNFTSQTPLDNQASVHSFLILLYKKRDGYKSSFKIFTAQRFCDYHGVSPCDYLDKLLALYTEKIALKKLNAAKIRRYKVMSNLMFCPKFAYTVNVAFRSNFEAAIIRLYKASLNERFDCFKQCSGI